MTMNDSWQSILTVFMTILSVQLCGQVWVRVKPNSGDEIRPILQYIRSSFWLVESSCGMNICQWKSVFQTVASGTIAQSVTSKWSPDAASAVISDFKGGEALLFFERGRIREFYSRSHKSLTVMKLLKSISYYTCEFFLGCEEFRTQKRGYRDCHHVQERDGEIIYLLSSVNSIFCTSYCDQVYDESNVVQKTPSWQIDN